MISGWDCMFLLGIATGALHPPTHAAACHVTTVVISGRSPLAGGADPGVPERVRYEPGIPGRAPLFGGHMEVAISGASGLIGRALTTSLRRDGHGVRRLVRSPSDEPDTVDWRPDEGSIDAGSLEGLDALVHLAGVGVGDRRWSPEHKRAVRDSRIRGTTLLAETLARLERPPRVFVSASGTHYYGDTGDVPATEKSPPGGGFLADLVRDWEAATQPAAEAGVRTVCTRSGVVVSTQGGAFPRLLTLCRWGLGGRLGSGRQWMSWIAIADEVAALRLLVENEELSGPVNLTSPQPVTNADLARTMGRVLRRPTFLAVPRFGPRLVLGREMADEMLFMSQRVEPEALRSAGFRFRHPDLEGALRAALGEEHDDG
jgi:uncharacterized protein